jgi:hypothetical protein
MTFYRLRRQLELTEDCRGAGSEEEDQWADHGEPLLCWDDAVSLSPFPKAISTRLFGLIPLWIDGFHEEE